MRETTESMMRRWTAPDYYRSVRVDYFPGAPYRLRFSAVGWHRPKGCIVSMESGPDIDTAIRRVLRAGLKKDKETA